MALRFYLDESKSLSAEDPAVCVAGYVGEGQKWIDFVKPWNKALDEAPKPVEVFHASDYDKGRKSKWGSYSGWSEDDREKFINRLVRLIRSSYFGFGDVGCVIHSSTFKQVATGKRSGKHGDLFVITAKVALINVSAWAIKHEYKYAPSFFIEEGSTYVEAIREALKQLKETEHPQFQKFFSLSAVSEVPKSRRYPQTQPADFLAYYSSKWASQMSGFDPFKESFDKFAARMNTPDMPRELRKLIRPDVGITYHTPASLDLLLTALETEKSLSEIDSIVYDDE